MSCPSPTTGKKNIVREARRLEALELRLTGLTLEEVGKRMGIGKPAVHQLITRTLESYRRTTAEQAEQVRALELARLDALQVKVWEMALNGNLGAVDRVLAIMKRRAELLGLDAPVKIEDVTPTTAPPSLEVFFVEAVAPAEDAAADPRTVLTIPAGEAVVVPEVEPEAAAANDASPAPE